MRKVNQLLASVVLGTALTACSVLPSNPPVNTYRLAPSTVDVVLQPLKLSLVVPVPEANRTVAHQRITVVTADNEVRAYQGARWEDTAPVVFRNRLVEDLQRAHAYNTVVSNDENVNVDRSLHLDLQSYQLQYKDTQPEVVISVNAALVNRRTSEIMASRRFTVEQAVASAQLNDILPVFAQLNDKINEEVIIWLRQQEH
ncbi:ABC-type transport auxiliary lipoprotein family protein [Pelistega europaea]|uniref:ABC-type transport auxiliary lipoprotein component domain-containing protein n=1 Tax=Pelistega europaea TaxID=106147 RepID=A0A7Y4LB39_9BURK|nr:ABC-type transport auxiliary lipoprotein family protein [Pelistega europaea]NOL50314.1 hypothetical protein [Pelistega europaea]